jgi:hypothetical protein
MVSRLVSKSSARICPTAVMVLFLNKSSQKCSTIFSHARKSNVQIQLTQQFALWNAN